MKTKANSAQTNANANSNSTTNDAELHRQVPTAEALFGRLKP